MSKIRKKCTDDSCCIHDDINKEFQCTKRNNEKNNSCDYYSHTPTPYCKLHNKLCDQYYSDYKPPCDKVWNTPYDLKQYSDEQLQDIVLTAKKCMKKRQKHLRECYANNADHGHLGAIDKMRVIIDRVNEELEYRYERKSKRNSENNMDDEILSRQELQLKFFIHNAKNANSDLYRDLSYRSVEVLRRIIRDRISDKCKYDNWRISGIPQNVEIGDFDALSKDELVYFIILSKNCVGA